MQTGPKIMGIMNLTPDSFSDGGELSTKNKIIQRVRQLEAEGADIIDIGGESSGPSSKNVSLREERKRVIPTLKIILKHTKLPISIDTYKSALAAEALNLGAHMINDVTALRGDHKMAKLLAERGVPVILMYSKDPTARTTRRPKKYTDVIKTIKNFLTERIKYAEANGIKSKNIIIDPGMGQFISSIPGYSFEIIARLAELKTLKKTILIGLSRKSFLGDQLAKRDQRGVTLQGIAYQNGANIIRTHNVKLTKEFFNHYHNGK